MKEFVTIETVKMVRAKGRPTSQASCGYCYATPTPN